MINDLFNFQVTAIGLIQIIFVILVGIVLVRCKVVDKNTTNAFNKIVMWVCLPALIISKVTRAFDPAAETGWMFLPVASMVVSTLGVSIAWLLSSMRKGWKSKGEFVMAASFQNCGYLPIALFACIANEEVATPILSSIFLFNMGFNICIWTYGSFFLKGGGERITLRF